MNVAEKLAKYCEDHGIKKRWLAGKIGIHPVNLDHWMYGSRKIPPKYWEKVINLTHGNIEFYDLLKEHFDEIPPIKVGMRQNNFGCYVSISELNIEV